MAENILAALERIARMKSEFDGDKHLMLNAATEIKRLRKELRETKAALEMCPSEITR